MRPLTSSTALPRALFTQAWNRRTASAVASS